MSTLQLSPRTAPLPRTRRSAQPTDGPRLVPAQQVRDMLLEIAFVLHATRAVRRLDTPDSSAQEDTMRPTGCKAGQ